MPYLKNASVRRDEDGDYWLFIEAGDLKAAFCISRKADSSEESIERRTLNAWLGEQDSSNGEKKAPR